MPSSPPSHPQVSDTVLTTRERSSLGRAILERHFSMVSEISSSSNLDGNSPVSPHAPLPPPPLSRSLLNRPWQLLTLQRLFDVPLTPSLATRDGGVVFDRLLGTIDGRKWWATLGLRVRAQRAWKQALRHNASHLRQSASNNSVGTPGAVPKPLLRVGLKESSATSLLDPDNYALACKARWQSPKGGALTVTAQADVPSMAVPAERWWARAPKRLTAVLRLKGHDLSGEASRNRGKPPPLVGWSMLDADMARVPSDDQQQQQQPAGLAGAGLAAPPVATVLLTSRNRSRWRYRLGWERAPDALAARFGVPSPTQLPPNSVSTRHVACLMHEASFVSRPSSTTPAQRASSQQQASSSTTPELASAAAAAAAVASPSKGKRRPFSALVAQPRRCLHVALGAYASRECEAPPNSAPPPPPTASAAERIKHTALTGSRVCAFGVADMRITTGRFERWFLDHTMLGARLDAAALVPVSKIAAGETVRAADCTRRGALTLSLTQQVIGPLRFRADGRIGLRPIAPRLGSEDPMAAAGAAAEARLSSSSSSIPTTSAASPPAEGSATSRLQRATLSARAAAARVMQNAPESVQTRALGAIEATKRVTVADTVFSLDIPLTPTAGAMKAVVWYAPGRGEGMMELRCLEA